MQKNFFKVKSFLIKFDLWSNTIATQLEDNRFRVVLDTADHGVFEYTGAFRIRPHCQLLQNIVQIDLPPSNDSM